MEILGLEKKIGNGGLSPEDQKRNQNLALLRSFASSGNFGDAATVAKELGLTELASAYQKMAQQLELVEPSRRIALPSPYHSPMILNPGYYT